MSGLPIRRRILGVDFGRVRIGIAVSDELGLLAHPVETIPAGQNAAKRIDEIAREKNVERVVIGLPRHMNGSMGEAAGEVLAFAGEIAEAASVRGRDLGRTSHDERGESCVARGRPKDARFERSSSIRWRRR